MTMWDFREELTLDSSRIPLVICINLLLFLLLLAFLFCLFIALEDYDHNHTTVPSPPSTTISHLHTQQPSASNYHSTTVTNRLHTTRGIENTSMKGEIASNESTGTGILRQEFAEREASTWSLYYIHPCYYFNLAKQAFLKCLGLDSASESDAPSSHKHRKTKQS